VRGGVCEIGAYRGQPFIPLALLRRTLGVYKAVHLPRLPWRLTDSFKEGQAANRDASGVGDRAQFRANCEAAGVLDATVLAADSLALRPPDLLAASAGRDEGGFRLFSVDGSHTRTEEAVGSELALAAAYLTPGGVILVDDALNPDRPGVTAGMCTCKRVESPR
jgi:hypothetical protein